MLWQQFERVSVTRPDDGEMAAVERGDPDRALPFGERDHRRVRPAQPQVSVRADKVLDALPSVMARSATSNWPSMMDA